jgi:hypothetical protein
MIQPIKFPFISVNPALGEAGFRPILPIAQHKARAVFVQAIVGQLEPVRLALAWTKATGIPLLLGQVNFFMEFDVCFHRSQLNFEVAIK